MAEQNRSIEDVIKKIADVETMYQLIRVVDPLHKRVIIIKESDNPDMLRKPCYDIWEKDSVCKNCISMRAYNEKESFIKIDNNNQHIYMVTAIPFEYESGTVVAELVKDVTKSMIMEKVDFLKDSEIKKIIDQANLAAVTDELTGVYNKRYVIEKFPVDILESHVSEQPLSVIIADIDFFKKVNDTYGHIAGDYVLQQFAKIIQQEIREETDWLARFGGEEFIVCLSKTSKEQAVEIAERIRKHVEQADFICPGHQVKITSSFGVCDSDEVNEKSYEAFIECADQKLYQAKRSGRNKVQG